MREGSSMFQYAFSQEQQIVKSKGYQSYSEHQGAGRDLRAEARATAMTLVTTLVLLVTFSFVFG
jgi:hypothetical protein